MDRMLFRSVVASNDGLETISDPNEALLSAARRSTVSFVEAALEKGANPKAKGKDGKTALHIAAYNCHSSLVKRMLRANAPIDESDNDGSTPLHCAVYYGRPSCVEILLSHGANTKLQDKFGRTALDIAKERNHIDVVALLEGHEKAKMKAENKESSQLLPTAFGLVEGRYQPIELDLKISAIFDNLIASTAYDDKIAKVLVDSTGSLGSIGDRGEDRVSKALQTFKRAAFHAAAMKRAVKRLQDSLASYTNSWEEQREERERLQRMWAGRNRALDEPEPRESFPSVETEAAPKKKVDFRALDYGSQTARNAPKVSPWELQTSGSVSARGSPAKGTADVRVGSEPKVASLGMSIHAELVSRLLQIAVSLSSPDSLDDAIEGLDRLKVTLPQERQRLVETRLQYQQLQKSEDVVLCACGVKILNDVAPAEEEETRNGRENKKKKKSKKSEEIVEVEVLPPSPTASLFLPSSLPSEYLSPSATIMQEMCRRALSKELFRPAVKSEENTLSAMLYASKKLRTDILPFAALLEGWSGFEEPQKTIEDLQSRIRKMRTVSEDAGEEELRSMLEEVKYESCPPLRASHPCYMWAEYSRRVEKLEEKLERIRGPREEADALLAENSRDIFRMIEVLKRLEVESMHRAPTYVTLARRVDELALKVGEVYLSNRGRTHAPVVGTLLEGDDSDDEEGIGNSTKRSNNEENNVL